MKVPVLLAVVVLSARIVTSQDSIKSETNVVYAKNGEKPLHLDWYRPADEKTYPGILMIHGGGWTGGSRKGFEVLAKEFASDGFVVANIDYRLAKEAKFPAAVLDSKAAVRWMRANAKQLGLDPDRIAAVGGSAGGHLAAMVANTAGKADFKDGKNNPDVSDALQAVVIMGAGVDQVARVKDSESGRIENAVVFFGGEYKDVPEVYAKGSPINHLSKETPPTLMIDGEKDQPGERYVEYRKKLDSFGVKNEFVMIPGAAHGEWVKPPFRAQFREAIENFLEMEMKPKPKPAPKPAE